jgi:hypothetical protein
MASHRFEVLARRLRRGAGGGDVAAGALQFPVEPCDLEPGGLVGAGEFVDRAPVAGLRGLSARGAQFGAELL